ncbi:hypothetical protein OGAPHI_001565 [Ogataea philodendri]|uniref:54S ribosomal protein L23, mitochondrial n=1 Tax=Ogataea philodendri TaxID=1378263 RepID=A0A9P8PDG3_9ASCO|nr:uncharacterized protein OGAPHI_001565 [Ogataea philodendri]KAH3669444.1 hypothetical protein OGAPHI_001565 [Ogataea philodendri]
MSNRIGKTGLGFARAWHHVDLAQDTRTLGRLASQIAITLMGKHKPITHETQDAGDYVVVSNAQFLRVTGNKMHDKTYWSHSFRPGSGTATPMNRVVRDYGYSEVIKRAVSKMLPKNKHRWTRLNRLKVYDGSEHPYKQNLVAFADQHSQVLEKVKSLEDRTRQLQEYEAKLNGRKI